MKKHKMSEQEFAQWVIDAEKLRGEMMKTYERADEVNLEEFTQKLNEA